MIYDKHIIIVAGGTGTRMNNSVPKQFIDLHGKPIIVHSIQKFIDFDPNINVVIVSHKNHLTQLTKLITDHFPDKKIQTCTGGETRFESVKNGLALLKKSEGVVGIHDAARPLVSLETIQNCFEMAAQKGNAIPVSSISESLRTVTNSTNKAVNRNDYKIVQTPQCFKTRSYSKSI